MKRTCIMSGEEFEIGEQELSLLKKIVAPLPRRHFEDRFMERASYRRKSGVDYPRGSGMSEAGNLSNHE